ncbi:MAG: phosphonate ABC transporter, permease protein PhnE [Propionibacteriaceae bacterium]|jgi:phosphonate transport system permease protein|nr:phosphonate ABC transporter, permease protein PhnE [Propionibacteriaceae bacterium]
MTTVPTAVKATSDTSEHRVVVGAKLTRFDQIFKPTKSYLADGTEVWEPRSRVPIILIFVLAFSVLSIYMTDFSLTVLVTRGKQFFVIIGNMFPPNWNYWHKVLGPLLDTIKMSVIGSFTGAVLAIPLAVVASSNMVRNKVVLMVARGILAVVRTLPSLITALIATFVFGLGTMAGTIAIGLFTFSYLGKQLYEMIETADMGPDEAMIALGATRPATFWTAIMPQVLPAYLSASLYCFEGNVRYAAILGYVGAGGIGLTLNENVQWRQYPNVGMVFVLLFATVVFIEWISHYLRKKLT